MTVKECFEQLRNHMAGGEVLTSGYALSILDAVERAFFQDSQKIEVWMGDNKKIYFGAGVEDLDSLIERHIKAAISDHLNQCHMNQGD